MGRVNGKCWLRCNRGVRVGDGEQGGSGLSQVLYTPSREAGGTALLTPIMWQMVVSGVGLGIEIRWFLAKAGFERAE